MKTFVVSSLRENSGKTSVIVGLSENIKGRIGYVKPFGDRLIYSKKRLWDYDAALMTNLYNMADSPESMSIGFDHSKLRYMYNESSIKDKVIELAKEIGSSKDILFVEGGRAIPYGESVHLDSLSLARYLNGRLIFVTSGDDDTILDDILFVKKNVNLAGIHLAGVIVNKVQNAADFNEACLPELKKLGITVLGVLQHQSELTYFSLEFLAEKLFAKVLAGESNLRRTAENIFIGAMSADTAMQKHLFKSEGMLIITGGDRTDMILAALESKAAGIILTNSIVPPANIVARVEEAGTPMILVNTDTYQVERQIEHLVPLLSSEDTGKVALLKSLILKHVTMEIMS